MLAIRAIRQAPRGGHPARGHRRVPGGEAFDVFCKALEHSQPQVRLAAAQGMNMIVNELEHPESCRDVLEWFESGWPRRHHLTFEKRPAEKSGAVRKLLREASSRLYHRHQLEEFDEEHLPKEEERCAMRKAETMVRISGLTWV